jgi:predicted transcriptional regulator
VIGIKIINPIPGPNTSETILEIIKKRQTGITIKEICRMVNRPVSMVQVCLKTLISSKSIYARKNKTGVGLIYYPRQNND